jgi:hypothetical protein
MYAAAPTAYPGRATGDAASDAYHSGGAMRGLTRTTRHGGMLRRLYHSLRTLTGHLRRGRHH